MRTALGRTTGRLVLVTAGGGRDGYALLQAALDAAAQPGGRPADWLLVTGPFMPEADRQKLADGGGTRRRPVVATVEHMPAHVAAADAVVQWAGITRSARFCRSSGRR